MRPLTFENKNFYHVFNRGVDKRDIFSDIGDQDRFLQSMVEFNSLEPIGSIFENSFRKKQLGNSIPKLIDNKLVNFICFCLNSNHYHFILEQLADGGIVKFMHRLGVGYTNYFNQKHDRVGSLFQGRFKAVHIDSNEYLLHLSVYVNLNDKIHRPVNSISKSSWGEYVREYNEDFCDKSIILDQFKNIEEYKRFSEESLKAIRERKDLEKYLLE